MKKTAFFTLAIAISLLTACSGDSTLKQGILTEEEMSDLIFLREEEKLARDVYLYSYAKYGDDLFTNISQSEQKHMDKVLKLLNQYNVPDLASLEHGVFTNPILQDLYYELTALSDSSLTSALMVGATIEDLDINDISDFEARTNKQNILNVYEKLKCGSRNHMRSYYSQLLNNDISYTPQFISQSELDIIISSGNEQCGGK